MLAYSKDALFNMAVQQQVKQASAHNLILPQQATELIAAHPVNLYTPNFFVKVGLGILTFFIVLAVIGLMILVSDTTNGALLLVAAVLNYGALEFFASKGHYDSGVDSVLMAASLVLFNSGVNDVFFDFHANDTLVTFCLFLSSLWLAVRFNDSIMATTATVALLLCCYFSMADAVPESKAILPLVMIAVAVTVNRAIKSLRGFDDAFYYGYCLAWGNITTLVALYAAGNFYVYHEFILEAPAQKETTLLALMGWFCWAWTAALPLAYIYLGVKRKNLVFTRLGLLAVIASILTFRYYHAILPAETAMIIAGIIVIPVVYLLIKYLRTPKHGFAFENAAPHGVDVPNLEGFVVGEVFGGQTSHQPTNRDFGGGNFGGGGAGSNY